VAGSFAQMADEAARDILAVDVKTRSTARRARAWSLRLVGIRAIRARIRSQRSGPFSPPMVRDDSAVVGDAEIGILDTVE